MESDVEFPSEIMDQVRELHGAAKVEAQRLRAEAEEAARTERAWAAFERFLAKGWVLHILELSEKEAPLLKKMRAENHPAIPFIEESYHLETSLRQFSWSLPPAAFFSGMDIRINMEPMRNCIDLWI